MPLEHRGYILFAGELAPPSFFEGLLQVGHFFRTQLEWPRFERIDALENFGRRILPIARPTASRFDGALQSGSDFAHKQMIPSFAR